MNPVPKQQGGLAGAHERITGLLDELNQTVDLVERLTRIGDHQGAIRLVEEQRAALYEAIDEVSHDVGRERRWWETTRRHATALVAALALILSSVAVAVGIREGSQPTLIEQANARIAQAQQALDPALRLQIVERVVEIMRELPADTAEKTQIADDLEPLVDVPEDAEDKGDDELIVQAERLKKEIDEQRPPPPGDSAPGTGSSPVEEITGTTEGALPPG